MPLGERGASADGFSTRLGDRRHKAGENGTLASASTVTTRAALRQVSRGIAKSRGLPQALAENIFTNKRTN